RLPEKPSPPPRCARATDGSRRGDDSAGRAHATPRRHPSRQGHPVAEALVFFDKTPEFIDLHLRRRHIPDEVAIDGGALLPGQLQPVQRGINCTVCDSADSPQAVALDEHRNDVQEERAWGAQCFKERNRSPSQKILARLDIYRVRSSHGYALAFTTSDLGSHPA